MSMPTTVSNAYPLHIRRPRSLSLALFAPTYSPLTTLPTEVALRIFELALLKTKASDLAVLSTFVQEIVNILIYRFVNIQSEEALLLFHRTIATRGSAHLAEYVKVLAITWTPAFHQPRAYSLVTEVALACTGVRVLSLPGFSSIPKNGLSSTNAHRHTELTHLTIERLSLDDDVTRSFYGRPIRPSSPIYYNRFHLITHLRICEPSEGWSSPSRILESFGPLAYLTHLQLARRAEANEANDIAFMEDLKSLLTTRLTLKMLVVSVFAPGWKCHTTVVNSSIWNLLQEVAEDDNRLVLLIGSWEEWKNDWKAMSALSSVPLGFWERCQERYQDHEL